MDFSLQLEGRITTASHTPVGRTGIDRRVVRESEGEALLRRFSLKAAILCRALDDDRTHPRQYFLTLAFGPLGEIARKVPGEFPSLGSCKRRNGGPRGGTPGPIEFCLKIAFGQAIAALDSAQDREAFDRARRLYAGRPRLDRLAIGLVARSDDGTVEMIAAVAVPAHVQRKRFGKGGWIDPFFSRRFGKFDNQLRFRAALLFRMASEVRALGYGCEQRAFRQNGGHFQ